MSELPSFFKDYRDAQSTTGLLERFDALQSQLENNDIVVKPGSRFYNYRNVLEHFDEVAETAEAENVNFKLLRQANYEIELLTVIVEQLSSEPQIGGWRSEVERLISGRDLPEKEGRDASPRDFQFELYVAALSRKAGFSIELAEPDVIVSHPDLEFGIAAKRPKSLGRVRPNIKKASEQIRRSDRQGSIAVDLSLAANPKNSCMIAEDTDVGVHAQDAYLDEYLVKKGPKIREVVGEKVIGITLFMSSTILAKKPMKVGFLTSWRATNLCDESDDRAVVFFDYVSQLASSI